MIGMRFCLTSAVAVLLFTAAPLWAGRAVTEEKSVEFTDEEDVSVEIDFGVGALSIAPGSSERIVFLEGHYDSRKFDYEFDYKKRAKHGDLYFDVSTRKDRWNDFDSEENEWRFEFTDKIPLDLRIDIGASECDLRLGGLMVSLLEIDIGAADCDISFDDPNKCSLGRIRIDAGASSVRIDRLGNSRFEVFEFEGGVGSYEIDFSGNFDYNARAEISVGLGSVDISIPEDIGVRIYAGDGFLSSIDFPRHQFEEIDNDVYESLNWDDATGHLELEVDVGLGSADIAIR